MTKCCIPFCDRTTRKDHPEWICAVHWKPVPPKLKALNTRKQNAVDKAEGEETAINDAKKVWAKCKRIATEKAMGI